MSSVSAIPSEYKPHLKGLGQDWKWTKAWPSKFVMIFLYSATLYAYNIVLQISATTFLLYTMQHYTIFKVFDSRFLNWPCFGVLVLWVERKVEAFRAAAAYRRSKQLPSNFPSFSPTSPTSLTWNGFSPPAIHTHQTLDLLQNECWPQLKILQTRRHYLFAPKAPGRNLTSYSSSLSSA